MSILDQLNSGTMYLICGVIVAFVAEVCVVFMVRAWRAGKALGMDTARMKQAIMSSVTFSVLPAVGILLGVIALSGALGIPWPWLRLSVIGALHYETQVAQAAAEQLGGSLNAESMTAQTFATVALMMSVCVMWGTILVSVLGKKYLARLSRGSAEERNGKLSFGDAAMTAMFIGMVSTYLGSYIGTLASGAGLLQFRGSWLPLAVAAAAALAMAVFTVLSEKKQMRWLDSFSIAARMLLGMAAAVLLRL